MVRNWKENFNGKQTGQELDGQRAEDIIENRV